MFVLWYITKCTFGHGCIPPLGGAIGTPIDAWPLPAWREEDHPEILVSKSLSFPAVPPKSRVLWGFPLSTKKKEGAFQQRNIISTRCMLLASHRVACHCDSYELKQNVKVFQKVTELLVLNINRFFWIRNASIRCYWKYRRENSPTATGEWNLQSLLTS